MTLLHTQFPREGDHLLKRVDVFLLHHGPQHLRAHAEEWHLPRELRVAPGRNLRLCQSRRAWPLQLVLRTADHDDLEGVAILWLENPGAFLGSIEQPGSDRADVGCACPFPLSWIVFHQLTRWAEGGGVKGDRL
jgi:hypothetical protein